MKVIPLTQGKFAKVDDEDYERVVNFGRWVVFKGRKTFYAQSSYKVDPKNRKWILMHRFILSIIPPGFEVDHVDGDALNNQKKNLRIATRAQNRANSGISIRNTSGRKGVRWCPTGKNWRATIQIGSRSINLGRYDSLEEAGAAYDKASVHHYGQFAKTNEMCLTSKTERNHENVN